MTSTVRQKKIIGSTDIIDLPELGLFDIPCKVDTGAQTSSLHCSSVRLIEKDDVVYVCFRLYTSKFGIKSKKEFRFAEFKEKKIRSSNGALDFRYSIRTRVIIMGRKYKTDFTLSFRDKMKFPILLGKKLLKNRFIVDVSLNNISYEQKTN